MTDTFQGHFGWARRRRTTASDAGTLAVVALWFVRVPNQAVGNSWSDFLLGVTHLRPIQGTDEPMIKRPGATHELLVLALEPGQSPTTPLPWKFITPAKVCVQFQVSSDLRAQKIAEDAAHACVDGRLVPESSVTMHGKTMLVATILDQWAEAIWSTAEHWETGGHHGDFN